MTTPNARVTEADVVIVGGGLVGTALALALAEQPLRIVLLETQRREDLCLAPEPAAGVTGFEPRVSALTQATQTLLADLGVWERIVQSRHCPYRQMRVWDAEGTGEISFDAADLQQTQLGYIVENRMVVRALVESVVASERITLLDGHHVERWRDDEGHGRVTLSDGHVVKASLVVGADGARSRMRQWAGLPTREWDYDQQAIVCTVKTAERHRFTAWQRFMPTGPLAFLPLMNEAEDDHYCSIVWSQDTDEAARLADLPEPEFRTALATAIEHRLGAIEAVSHRFMIPLRQRHARHYVRPGVALVGDAAHTIHPLAGQGVNLGFADVAVLADEVRRASRRGVAPGDMAVLRRYERRRKGDNLAMMAAVEGFKQLFGRDELPVRWLRNTGMRWLEGQGFLKNRIASEAMGLNLDIPRFYQSEQFF